MISDEHIQFTAAGDVEWPESQRIVDGWMEKVSRVSRHVLLQDLHDFVIDTLEPNRVEARPGGSLVYVGHRTDGRGMPFDPMNNGIAWRAVCDYVQKYHDEGNKSLMTCESSSWGSGSVFKITTGNVNIEGGASARNILYAAFMLVRGETPIFDHSIRWPTDKGEEKQ